MSPQDIEDRVANFGKSANMSAKDMGALYEWAVDLVESAIVRGYIRGAAWQKENPDSDKYLAKAAHDYADKTLNATEEERDMNIPTMPPKRWRKKPVEIEAAQIPPVTDINGRIAFEDWLSGRYVTCSAKWVGSSLEIETLEGVMTGNVGDYIISGVQGELYPCKPEIFEATYEAVE